MVARVDVAIWFKVCGRANFALSVDFKTAVAELEQRGYAQFVLDLTECVIMDSTFVGVLAGLHRRLNSNQAGSPRLPIRLVNPNNAVSNLLDNLGISHFFDAVQCSPLMAEFSETSVSRPTPVEIARTSLEAHQTLMEMNPANIPKFKDVALFLAEDLKKLEKD
ncbi:MAG: STAS domain-containing protein [Candidatus Omnitrophica bacterium]|nr:STAS domain-containing protein [Candidatus Omnitrophota bacterium]